MPQININVNEGLDQFFDYFAKKKKIPKAVYVKQLLLEHIQETMLLTLLKEYEKGSINLKKILNITEISTNDLLDKIVEYDIECPITPELDDYTWDITQQLIKELEEKKTHIQAKATK